MCYAVIYIESGVHFIAAFGANLGELTPRNRAWRFMRECDALGISAGFPFAIDTNGNPTGGI